MTALAGTPVIETDRLILRAPQEGDWPAYRDYRMSARSTTGAIREVGEIWGMFAAFFGHWTLRGYGRFIAVLRTDGTPVGHFGPYFPEGHPERELTWTLWHADREGRGYAFEAATAVGNHLFGPLGWVSAVSYIEPGNLRSQALARRLGAVLELDATDPYHGATQIWRHPAPEALA